MIKNSSYSLAILSPSHSTYMTRGLRFVIFPIKYVAYPHAVLSTIVGFLRWNLAHCTIAICLRSLCDKVLCVTVDLSIFVRLTKSIYAQTSFIVKCATPSAQQPTNKFSRIIIIILSLVKWNKRHVICICANTNSCTIKCTCSKLFFNHFELDSEGFMGKATINANFLHNPR